MPYAELPQVNRSARLALACANKIADAALDSFPEAPASAALIALALTLTALVMVYIVRTM